MLEDDINPSFIKKYNFYKNLDINNNIDDNMKDYEINFLMWKIIYIIKWYK